MTLIELVYREAGPRFKSMLVAAVATGATNGLALSIANTEAKRGAQPGLGSFLVFVAAMALFIACARFLYRRTAQIFQGVLHALKLRLADKLLRADMRALEQLGAAEIYDRVTENVAIISIASGNVAHLLQLAFILAFGIAYVASISTQAFVLILGIMALGLAMFRTRDADVKARLREAARARLGFFDRFTDLLRGFKEIKASARRGEELRADVARTADEVRGLAEATDVMFAEKYVFARLLLFTLIAALMLVLPQYAAQGVTFEPQLLAAVLYVHSPISGLLFGFPAMVRANIALEQIEALELKLDRFARPGAVPGIDPWVGCFETIELREVELRYTSDGGEEAFHVGPLDLKVVRGEVLFIVGGNGSGKSTLFKLLTGLYLPGAGTLCVDGVALAEENAQAYREMVAAVHADFHLFKRLYGLGDVAPEAVRGALEKLRIDHKTRFVRGEFSTLALSTGQRKRLATAVALLEDRLIYAFDEWAADQDPEFRRYFYHDLLAELKGRGKTVFVVTHDDRYFDVADRVLTLENGKIRSLRATARIHSTAS